MVHNPMADSGPSTPTIKRLFAVSGNRCAFPKCNAPMVLADTLVGEICHIKGKRPEAARYDPTRPIAELNDYDNLILLCATHHKVVDDDEEAYTVARLRRMKAEHEAQATPIAETEADRVALSISALTNVGESGGIAANSIVANTVTLSAGQPSDAVLKRQIEALENLWNVILTLQVEFGSIIYVDQLLLAREMDEFFRTGRRNEIMEAVHQFADTAFVAGKLGSVKPHKERPYVSNSIWSIIFILRGLYGRSALLIQNSFLDGYYHDWRTDSGIDQLLRAILPASLVDSIKQKPTGGLWVAIQHLETAFLSEAGLQKDG
jgi:hypothetical protein